MSEKISEEREQRARRKKSDRSETDRIGKKVSFSDWLVSIVERKKAELRDSRIKDRESPESDSKIDDYRGKRG